MLRLEGTRYRVILGLDKGLGAYVGLEAWGRLSVLREATSQNKIMCGTVTGSGQFQGRLQAKACLNRSGI